MLSRAVLAEYRAILTDEQIAGPYGITPEAVDLMLRRLKYFGEHAGQMRARFRFDRDPGDEKFIELAITGKATRIVTCDKVFFRWLRHTRTQPSGSGSVSPV